MFQLRDCHSLELLPSFPSTTARRGSGENWGTHKVPRQKSFTLQFSSLCYQPWMCIPIPHTCRLPNSSLESHTTLPQIWCSGTHTEMFVCFAVFCFCFCLLLMRGKADPRWKSSALTSWGRGPGYQATFTEVTNMSNLVFSFLSSFLQLEFVFLVRVYLDIPLESCSPMGPARLLNSLVTGWPLIDLSLFLFVWICLSEKEGGSGGEPLKS